MQHSQAVELALFLASCFMFLGYHLWLFKGGSRLIKRQSNMWRLNLRSRASWAVGVAHTPTDPGQTYVVQALRNSITASAFLATACSLIAVSGIGMAILDSNRLSRLESIARSDPVLNGGPAIFSPTTKLAISEAVILFAFLCLVQSIRLQVHMGFFSRNIAYQEQGIEDGFSDDELVAIFRMSTLCFSLGLRAFYAFIPLLMWVAGPTWLIVITFLEVVSLFITDSIHLPKRKAVVEKDLEKGESKADSVVGDKESGKSNDTIKPANSNLDTTQLRSRHDSNNGAHLASD